MSQPLVATDSSSTLIESGVVDDRQVSMSNRLVRAAHSLNLSEKRLIALGLAATDSRSEDLLTKASIGGWKMRVTALEYAECFGIDASTAYTQIKSASDNLFERYVRYDKRKRNGDIEETKVRWVSKATHFPGEGCVELHFTSDMAPHLLGLRTQFTTYKLRSAAAFDSVYAWKLFELLKSWQSTSVYATEIEDFWEVMEAPPSCRKDFKALRVRIIEPAVAAVRIKGNLLIDWVPTKKGGRRVTGLKFTFQPNPQQNFDMDTSGGPVALDEAIGNELHSLNPRNEPE